jgi:exfoliative toxin A/B
MAAITAHIHGLGEIGFAFFLFGFASMIITVPLIIYRYYRYSEIPDMNKPLICITTAIFSILIVGYINSAQGISDGFLSILYFLACACYVFAFYKLVEYRNLKFYPSFSAFTFPFVISALATKGVGAIIQNSVLNYVLLLETAIAVMVVVYVLIKYLKFLKIVEVDG